MKHAIRWVDISVSDTDWRAHSRAAARAVVDAARSASAEVDEVERVVEAELQAGAEDAEAPRGEGGTVEEDAGEDDAVPASAGTCGPHDMAEFKKCFSQTTGLGPH